MAKIIALSGWAKSGKDTLAKYLEETVGTTRLAFADILKDEVSKQYGFPREWCDNEHKEKALLKYPVMPKDVHAEEVFKMLYLEFRNPEGYKLGEFDSQKYLTAAAKGILLPTDYFYWTPRSILIIEGLTKRAVDSSFWTNKVINKIDTSSNNIYVVSDVRFKSELDALRSRFGEDLITVRIDRFIVNPSTNISETELDNEEFDVKLNNKEDFEAYFKEADNKLLPLLKPEELGLDSKFLAPEFL